MSLSCLATVELQLVMQCCDLASLLRLARCSRSTLSAAVSDFAWRFLSPLHILSTNVVLLQSLRHSRLLRGREVALEWSVPAGQSKYNVIDARELARICESVTPPGRLVGLNQRARHGVSKDNWLLLLRHPNLQHLRELHLDRVASSDFLLHPGLCAEAARSWPQLSFLSLYSALVFSTMSTPFGKARGGTGSQAQQQPSHSFENSLSSFPSLTYLRLEMKKDRSLVAAAVAACKALRTLELIGAPCASWSVILSSEHLRATLQHLILDTTAQQRAILVDWQSCFTNLHALQTLAVRRSCFDVNELIHAACAYAAPSFRKLTIDLRLVSRSVEVSSLDALVRLMQSRTGLRLVLHATPHSSAVKELQQQWPSRVHIDPML